MHPCKYQQLPISACCSSMTENASKQSGLHKAEEDSTWKRLESEDQWGQQRATTPTPSPPQTENLFVAFENQTLGCPSTLLQDFKVEYFLTNTNSKPPLFVQISKAIKSSLFINFYKKWTLHQNQVKTSAFALLLWIKIYPSVLYFLPLHTII